MVRTPSVHKLSGFPMWRGGDEAYLWYGVPVWAGGVYLFLYPGRFFQCMFLIHRHIAMISLICLIYFVQYCLHGFHSGGPAFPYQPAQLHWNVFREDVVTNGEQTEKILRNAPARKDDMFAVPKTFD